MIAFGVGLFIGGVLGIGATVLVLVPEFNRKFGGRNA